MMAADGSARKAGTGLEYVSNPAELPQGTLVDLFLDAVDKGGARAQLFRTMGGWQPVSHAEILHNVRAIAAALRSTDWAAAIAWGCWRRTGRNGRGPTTHCCAQAC
jgi:hypothetical protein